MIKSLEISGFKSIDHAKIELNNFTLLAGANSMGKTTVIQSNFALLQSGNNPFRGEYMNIGKVNELITLVTDSNEIKLKMQYEEDNQIRECSKCIVREGVKESQGAIKNFKVIYCSAERVGVKDTYEKYLGDEIYTGKNCEYVFHYLAENKDLPLNIEKDFIYQR